MFLSEADFYDYKQTYNVTRTAGGHLRSVLKESRPQADVEEQFPVSLSVPLSKRYVTRVSCPLIIHVSKGNHTRILCLYFPS